MPLKCVVRSLCCLELELAGIDGHESVKMNTFDEWVGLYIVIDVSLLK